MAPLIRHRNWGAFSFCKEENLESTIEWAEVSAFITSLLDSSYGRIVQGGDSKLSEVLNIIGVREDVTPILGVWLDEDQFLTLKRGVGSMQIAEQEMLMQKLTGERYRII